MLRISARDAQVEQMVGWVKAGSTPQAVVLRSMIVLEAHRGRSDKAISEKLCISQPTVRLWKPRFLEGGSAVLTHVAAGRGRKPKISRRKIAAALHATQHTRPEGATHWAAARRSRHRGSALRQFREIGICTGSSRI